MKNIITIAFLLLNLPKVSAQFAPPDGQPGTTAMHMDSSAFKTWAVEAKVVRGFQDISDTLQGLTTVGDSSSCLGKADNMVVSLGDGGVALITLQTPIFDGPSWDFAIFENSFVNNFLELAFVEVSSDGQNYYRFPAASLTPDTLQIGAFDFLDATKINNLAGKYRGGFGTPFDLSELAHHTNLDVQNIKYIKVIDVVGSILENYGSKDTSGRFINDPWPTPFPSSGFDLDAIGLIHTKAFGLSEYQNKINLYPNPTNGFLNLELEGDNSYQDINLYDLNGEKVFSSNISVSKVKLDLTSLDDGTYILVLEKEGEWFKQIITIIR